MTFTQVDDAWPDSPEVLAVSRSARLLEVEGKCYCNRHLTDGRITRSQWLRATDTETFDQDLTELIDARLVEVAGPGVYQLDWTHQQSREQVHKSRERRRADNDRRARALELHRSGDHSLCTHEGGGRARQTVTPSTGPSSGPSISTSTGLSTGPSNGRKGGRSNGSSRGRSEVGSPSPTQPSPAQPVVKRRGGGDGRRTDGSGGPTPSVLAREGAAGGPLVPRPAVVTLADLPGSFRDDGGAPRTQEELDWLWERIYADPESALYGTWTPASSADSADAADSLAGLIPAGGAGGS